MPFPGRRARRCKFAGYMASTSSRARSRTRCPAGASRMAVCRPLTEGEILKGSSQRRPRRQPSASRAPRFTRPRWSKTLERARDWPAGPLTPQIPPPYRTASTCGGRKGTPLAERSGDVVTDRLVPLLPEMHRNVISPPSSRSRRQGRGRRRGLGELVAKVQQGSSTRTSARRDRDARTTRSGRTRARSRPDCAQAGPREVGALRKFLACSRLPTASTPRTWRGREKARR